MPEQESAKRGRSNPQSATSDVTSTAEVAAQQHLQPVLLADSTASSEEQAQKQEHSPQKEQLERIRQLEQALDLSQAQVSELRSQLHEQQMLQTQLVATEEVANLQQLALAQLKHQLTCQQENLESHKSQAQAKDQHCQELLATIETLASTSQFEIEHLKALLTDNRTAVKISQKKLEKQLASRQIELESKQQRVQELESQILATRTRAVRLEVQLTEQERHIQSLYSRLSDRAYMINQMEAQLEQAHEALEAQQNLHVSLMETQALSREQNTIIANLDRQIELLETELAGQAMRGARLQQACSELVESSDRAIARTTELESNLSALQEQILMQAQQASEYEAAVQYWKDQCGVSQHQAQQLKEVLERLLPDRPDEILELLMTIQSLDSGTPMASPQPGKHLHVELPDFLRKASARKGASEVPNNEP